jgi:hypothetical protein
MTIVWTDAQGRSATCIHRFHHILVGLTHKNKAGEDRIALARRVTIGTPLLLVQETNNPIDGSAILIYLRTIQATISDIWTPQAQSNSRT